VPNVCVVICGPTAVGKSSIALKLAHEYGEIVNADSRQVYKHLAIGTAQPSAHEKKNVRHHLYGYRSPRRLINAAVYARQAVRKIHRIHRRNNIPFLVGGTGLYINAVINNSVNVPGKNSALRKKLYQHYTHEGAAALYADLLRYDPESAHRLHPNDAVRIIRALEIYYTSGKTLSEYMKCQNNEERYLTLFIGIRLPREELYNRINRRTRTMLSNGWIDEVKSLLHKGIDEKKHSLQSVGYRDIIAYLNGSVSYEEMVESIQQQTRRYAKRQLTWFRNDHRVQWFSPNDIYRIKVAVTSWVDDAADYTQRSSK